MADWNIHCYTSEKSIITKQLKHGTKQAFHIIKSCSWKYIISICLKFRIPPPPPPQLTRPSKVKHDDLIKWKHFPRYWPFVRGIHRSPVNSPHKGQWRGALIFSLICVWINGWVNNREAGDLRRYRAHYDVSVMTHMPNKLNLAIGVCNQAVNKLLLD